MTAFKEIEKEVLSLIRKGLDEIDVGIRGFWDSRTPDVLYIDLYKDGDADSLEVILNGYEVRWNEGVVYFPSKEEIQSFPMLFVENLPPWLRLMFIAFIVRDCKKFGKAETEWNKKKDKVIFELTSDFKGFPLIGRGFLKVLPPIPRKVEGSENTIMGFPGLDGIFAVNGKSYRLHCENCLLGYLSCFGGGNRLVWNLKDGTYSY